MSCNAYTIGRDVFDWDENNLKKIKAHRVTAAEVEQALAREPILVYEQEADGESRYVYYGESDRNRLLAIILTERNEKIRVITAYTLDAGQKRDYMTSRARGE
jgi:uncharacterized DUF497 family protein